MVSSDDLDELRQICAGATLKSEGLEEFVHLPALPISTADKVEVREALLTMQGHSGYVSRLFLAKPIDGRGANWTSHAVLGRTWCTPSWKDVAPGRPLEMVLQHLKAYR